ncbi:MAG: IS3 family transposase, partial [Phycisphaeraceae bacterium]|nr:IS3 family transposase [Phycisphaeraceae bacterium]
REELTAHVHAVHETHRRVYGSPRVHQALLAQGVKACVNTVAKVMRQAGLAAKKKRKYVPRTTDSSRTQRPAENLLQRNFAPGWADQRWAGDITYVPTREGWLYLAAVLDVGTRRIIGWAMAASLKADLVVDALRMALTRRGLPRTPAGTPALICHSDRGTQYDSDACRQLLDAYGLIMSMSGKGDCYDNAVTESFWATLKTELIHDQDYATRAEAQASIFEYIEVFYNRVRLHSTLGYVSPETFEASLT